MTQIQSKSKALEEKLSSLKRQEEEKKAKQLAGQLNLPYLDLKITPIEQKALPLVLEKKARNAKMAVIQKKSKQLWAAAKDPENPLVKKILKELEKEGYQINLFVSSESGLERAWQAYQDIPKKEVRKITGQVDIEGESLKNLKKEINNLDDIKKKIEETPTDQISKVVEILLAGSLETKASDIHLETEQEKAIIRYRIDGILQDAAFLSSKSYSYILNRIKLLSGMKLNVADIAQGGRFTIGLDKTDIEIRVSAIPSAYGENIVMRILDPGAINLELEDLGLRQDILDVVYKEIQKPNGMIITTGPTGSGKTTLLYSFIRKVNKPESKIITLEDPIEYHLEGITQTQTDEKKGYTFAKGLRAILRQDPDIILVGEIRDEETATIAVQAALTGHLVFSTLHTNDAAGAIPRFLDIGVDASNLASALNLIIAQRLVRRICKKCAKKKTTSGKELDQIKKSLKGIPPSIKHPTLNNKLKIYQAVGCQECNNTGYKSRIGIFEIIVINQEMEKLISSSPDHFQIIKKTKEGKMVSFTQDALLKALDGLTTIEEIERIVGPLADLS